MKLTFPTREEWYQERSRLLGMKSKDLEKLLGQLYEKRYVEQDINYESYYRLVSHVYIQKTREGQSLIFHLKNFLG